MNAIDAAEAMKQGILAAAPECDVVCIPVADGGDGLEKKRDTSRISHKSPPIRHEKPARRTWWAFLTLQ
ncbi:MAG: hypothetical protein BA871_16820 [Desulfuromonadales bacterium C00003096]|nr:MAG: hypothetical protein BA871_16820 [Desulfuromonadales bacterium C00003096]